MLDCIYITRWYTVLTISRNTLFNLQNYPFNKTSSAARSTPNNGRMTVNNELGRMWKEITVMYYITDSETAWRAWPTNQISFSLDNISLDQKTKLRLVHTKQKCQPLYGVLQDNAIQTAVKVQINGAKYVFVSFVRYVNASLQRVKWN